VSDLLQVSPVPARRGATPLFIESKVNPESAPFLVSSRKAMLWVQRSSMAGFVRAAVRTGVEDNGEMYLEVVRAIAQMGSEAEWGNVQPWTEEGLQEALSYLAYFGFTEVELLIPNTKEAAKFVSTQTECEITVADWLEPGMVVAIPKDRSFVGSLGRIDEDSVVVVVHNPSRGVTVVRREE